MQNIYCSVTKKSWELSIITSLHCHFHLLCKYFLGYVDVFDVLDALYHKHCQLIRNYSLNYKFNVMIVRKLYLCLVIFYKNLKHVHTKVSVFMIWLKKQSQVFGKFSHIVQRMVKSCSKSLKIHRMLKRRLENVQEMLTQQSRDVQKMLSERSYNAKKMLTYYFRNVRRILRKYTQNTQKNSHRLLRKCSRFGQMNLQNTQENDQIMFRDRRMGALKKFTKCSKTLRIQLQNTQEMFKKWSHNVSKIVNEFSRNFHRMLENAT